MDHRRFSPKIALLGLILAAWAASPSMATMVQITVTNNQPTGGFSLTPVWFGVHDGSFVSFTPGGTTGLAWQTLAELGDNSAITSAFAGHGVQGTLPSAIGAFTPGLTATITLDVTDPAALRYLSFGSMVVPTNDLFLGNGDPKAIALFDAGGSFLGPKTLTLTGADVWDAGTEVNNINDHPAFVAGIDGVGGARENGTAGLFFDRNDAGAYLSSINGVQTAAGYAISHLFSRNESLLTIRISAVPSAVPEPSTALLCGLGLGAVAIAGGIKRVRRSRTLA